MEIPREKPQHQKGLYEVEIVRENDGQRQDFGQALGLDVPEVEWDGSERYGGMRCVPFGERDAKRHEPESDDRVEALPGEAPGDGHDRVALFGEGRVGDKI